MITARLVHQVLSVPLEKLFILELNQPTAIEGVRVTAIEANHCPGACMFLFEAAGEPPTLHTGDCRCNVAMRQSPILARIRGQAKLIMDTTYCSSKYPYFPPKEAAIQAIAKIVKAELASNPKALILVGSYTIGKELVYFHLAQELGLKVYIGAKKRRILKCIDLHDTHEALITSDDMETRLHVVPLGHLKSQERMEAILQHYKKKYTGIISICPTGWSVSHNPKKANLGDIKRNPEKSISRLKKGRLVMYSVPYSEHSSFEELKEFVTWFQPKDIIPSVKIKDQEAFGCLRCLSSSFCLNAVKPENDGITSLPFGQEHMI